MDGKIVGLVIRRYRKEKKMSQELISGFAGLDRTHYSKIERGLRLPKLDTLFKIAAALEVPPDKLVGAIDEELQKNQKDPLV